VAHEIVDRMGVTWAHETADELGRGPADVARAYWCARSVLAADRRWARVEGLVTSIPADAQEALDQAVAEAVNQLARRYLLDGIEDPAHDRAVARLLEPSPSGSGGDGVASLVEAGVPLPVAQEFAALPALGLAADVAMVLRTRSLPAGAAGAVLGAFHAVDSALGLPGVRKTLENIPAPGRWGRWQARRLGDDVASLRRDVVLAALAEPSSPSPAGRPDGDPSAAVAGWLAIRGVVTSRFHRLTAHLRDPDADVACVAALAIRALAELVPAPRPVAAGQPSAAAGPAAAAPAAPLAPRAGPPDAEAPGALRSSRPG
jgi:glutamate dehydrogenase